MENELRILGINDVNFSFRLTNFHQIPLNIFRLPFEIYPKIAPETIILSPSQISFQWFSIPNFFHSIPRTWLGQAFPLHSEYFLPKKMAAAANAIVAAKALSKGKNLFGRRDSLIKQASIDREQNEGLRRQNTLRNRKELERNSTLCKPLLQRLNDDSVELIRTANEDGLLDLLLILHCGADSRDIIQSALHRFLSIGLHLTRLETRPDLAHHGELEMRAQLNGKKWMFLEVLTKLVLEKAIERIELRHLQFEEAAPGKDEAKEPTNDGFSLGKIPWFPRHVSELDQCAHVLVKYEPTEDPKHPGFGDQRYIARRAELNELANSYRHGEAIPFVEYKAEEHATWKTAYLQLKELRETHTCQEYQRNIAQMESVGLITADRIPQLRDLSAYIQRKTGFELRPCGGLLSARDFLASLAFRVFQATLYVRHSSAPHHCPEPDVIHEVLGHCPMFADENLAQMSQEIGLLSLGASDEQIERLATVYWFIIEFGLCKQQGQLRAIGAGLLSAYGELKFACSEDGPEHEPFKPEVTALRPYEDSDYQPVYFVADSIEKAMEDVRAYARSLCPSRTNIYNPLTRTAKAMPTKQMVEFQVAQLQKECAKLMEMMATEEKATTI